MTSKKISDLSNRILDAIPDMLVLYDSNATILDVRHPYPELMYSPKPEQAIGRRLTEGELKKTSEFHISYFNSVCNTHQPCQFVYRHKTQDGEEKFYEVFLSYLEEDRVLADIRNITKHSVAQIESKHLHYFFSEVLDNIAIPVSVKSMDTGRYIYWSKKAEIFGRAMSEMIGSTENPSMSLEQARSVRQIELKLAKGELKQYQGIEKYTTYDGREHTFMVTRTPFTFGEEKLILSSALDISELKETQTSLLHTKNELARKNMALYSVLSLAKVIPWGCDLINQTFYCDYTAYHPEYASGPDEQGRYVISMDHYFNGVHPDYRERAIQMIDELLEGKRTELHDIYLVHWFNNQEWEWVQVQSCISERNKEGQPTHLIGSAQRITEQKKTEIDLRKAKKDLAVKNMVLSSVLGIAQVIPWNGDLNKQTFYCDYDTYHHENADGPDSQGRYILHANDFFDRIHPDHRVQAYDQYLDLSTGRASEFHEIYPIHWYNDREYEWVEVLSNISQYDPEGKPLQLIGSIRIITEQKRMEESLREAKEQAERSNTLKSAFLANMSHEIRTPLNAIVGFSELLAQTEENEDKQEYLNIIRNSNVLLLQLIGDILDLSKIEAGTLEFSFADHNLNALMDELEQTARMKVINPAIEIACTHQLPDCTIRTDRGRLLQVLHNFINNAAKFTEQGHIHFGFLRHPDNRWYFYVEDTGCGIPANKTKSVFERFVKLSKKAQGTGLGLAISKSIIERLGGEIGVFSAEGQGSTFWFLLPAESIVTAAASKAKTTGDSLPVSGKSSAPLSILIAEDDPSNYKLFEAMLKKNYTLLHAWNGQQAVEMFKEYHPNIILMDIKMPEMDGYEATATIRKQSGDIPIIAVTAFAFPEDMRRILSSGFNGCLSKPVNANELKNKILEIYSVN